MTNPPPGSLGGALATGFAIIAVDDEDRCLSSIGDGLPSAAEAFRVADALTADPSPDAHRVQDAENSSLATAARYVVIDLTTFARVQRVAAVRPTG